MNNTLCKNFLKQNLNDFSNAINWLKHSFTICAPLSAKSTFSIEEYDALDALTSRYARCTDLLIDKILRSLDTIELITGGTILDVINRAYKRGLINSADDLRKMKETHNQIAHEYANDELTELFHAVLHYTPMLLDIAEKLPVYCEKYV